MRQVGWVAPDPRTIARPPERPHPREQDAPIDPLPSYPRAHPTRARRRPARAWPSHAWRVGRGDRAAPRPGGTGICRSDTTLGSVRLTGRRHDADHHRVRRQLPQSRGIARRLGPRPGRRSHASHERRRKRLETRRAVHLVRQAAGGNAYRDVRIDRPRPVQRHPRRRVRDDHRPADPGTDAEADTEADAQADTEADPEADTEADRGPEGHAARGPRWPRGLPWPRGRPAKPATRTPRPDVHRPADADRGADRRHDLADRHPDRAPAGIRGDPSRDRRSRPSAAPSDGGIALVPPAGTPGVGTDGTGGDPATRNGGGGTLAGGDADPGPFAAIASAMSALEGARPVAAARPRRDPRDDDRRGRSCDGLRDVRQASP